jgi:DNA-binding CsgD family transcriptional regulator
VQQLADSRARLLLLRNRASEAQQQLDAQLEWQTAWGCSNPGWTSTRSLAARAYLALGKDDEARSLAARDLEAAKAFGAPRSVGIALRVMALVGAEFGIEQLRESATVLEGSEAKLELARTLIELGAALRRGGARRDSREPLRRGLELADECGGALVALRAREELLASGARPGKRRSMGREALTPSERRVAALAKDGLSNREIAQALFLSPKTVEMHLSHVYRKLSIRGRNELATTLEADEATGG